MEIDEPHSMGVDPQPFVDDSQSSSGELRWKVGAEVPPFVSENTSVVQFLLSIYDGTVDAIPSIVVSKAVAVQIHRLVFDKFPTDISLLAL